MTPRLALLAPLLAAALTADVAAQQAVVSSAAPRDLHFESGPTRPLLLSPDGATLYVLNTSDHRLELYDTAGPSLTYLGAVFTGLEPVSMALHPDDPGRLFVANLLSDSLAVVDLDERRLLATVPVGDEPQDVVVVDGRVAVTTARSAADPDLLEPGGWVENALVLVDAEPPYAVLSRTELAGHKPRALAAGDGVVHVVPLDSGNHTTILSVPDQQGLGMDALTVDAFDPPFEVNPSLLAPGLSSGQFLNTSFGINGWELPRTSRIVFDHEYPDLVTQLADQDLFSVDVASGALLPGTVDGVGTTLLALARHPASGTLWVANTEARNRTRFEPSVKGAAFDNRITRVDPAGGVLDVLSLEPPLTSAAHAQPVALAFHDGPSGDRAYVAALGTDTVVVLDGSSGALVTELASGPLPIGLAVDGARELLYVLTLGDKTVRRYDIAAGHAELGRPRPLAYDAELPAVVTGRRHLYDARPETGAGTGNLSCASCHVFGHLDALAWDLGDPGGGLGWFYTDLMAEELSLDGDKIANKKGIMTHPMKGPMTTQSLRGLGAESSAPLHWRGDRRFVQMFRGAFVGLLGGSGKSRGEMQEFAGFLRGLEFPPNPYQRRDRTYTGAAAAGAELYGMNDQLSGKTYNPLVPGVSCIDCHEGNFADGSDFTGGQATVNFDGPDQFFNSAGLRGVYEKEDRHLTGYGTSHDGDQTGVRGFLDSAMGGIVAFPALTNAEKDQVTAFVQAWDTGLSPLVGVQHTVQLAPGGLAAWSAYLDLAETRARPPHGDVDLIAKLRVQLPDGGGLPVGLVFAEDPADGQWRYRADVDRWIDRSQLELAVAAGLVQASFACVPPGWGTRLGVDRDEDGLLDGVERSLGSALHDPDSDDDGYADGPDLALGGHPLVPDALLAGDTNPPAVGVQARDVFVDSAGLRVVLDEPGSLGVALGSAPGEADLGQLDAAELRRVHDLVVGDLPAATEVHVTVTASDRNGNQGAGATSFTTAPPFLRVVAMELESDGAPAPTLTCRVTVVDHTDQPVAEVPVKLVWAGDIGDQEFFAPLERTDAAGVSVHTLGPYTPAGPTTVTASVVFLGSNNADDPFFIGFGGDEPTFFYDQSSNAVNFVSVELP